MHLSLNRSAATIAALALGLLPLEGVATLGQIELPTPIQTASQLDQVDSSDNQLDLAADQAAALANQAQPIPPDLDAMPDGLTKAVKRDLGLTATQYVKAGELAQQAAKISQTLSDSLEPDDVSIKDGNRIEVVIDNAAESEAVVAVGATPVRRTASVLTSQPAETLAPTPASPPSTPDLPLPPMRPLLGIGPAVGSKYLTDDWLSCTLAFWGYDRNGQPVALTAGHCNKHGGQLKQMSLKDPWSSSGDPDDEAFGKFTTSRYGQGFDAALVDAHDDVLANPKVHRWQGKKTMTITGQVAPMVGAPVCKSGARTGWTCGWITAIAKSFNLADVGNPEVSGFTTSMCSANGDSGAPVMSGRYAVGVLSFGSYDIRDGDGQAACGIGVQTARFLTDSINQYPVSAHDTVRRMLVQNPDDLILTGVVPLTGPGASIESLFGDDFRLALSVPQPKVTSAKTSSSGGTKIKGKVKLNDLKSADLVIKLRLKGRTLKVKPNAKGVFTARWPKVKRRAKYMLQAFIGGQPRQRSFKVTGRTKVGR